MIDRDGFERALANVLDNALRHTPQGGTVDVACGEAADHAFIRVIDDGPGIAPDLLPHLFQLTARAASNGRTGGAGLGLTIAARLLRNQGGAIEAANAPPRGDPHAPASAEGRIAPRTLTHAALRGGCPPAVSAPDGAG